MGIYNNLILFDQHVAQNSLEAIRPDLATKWSWNEDGTELTFTLHQGVKWHDGMPFTAKDVLCTIDLQLDKARDKVRFNPRKSNFKNLESVTADNDYQVTFHLKRPQPAFPMLLANGFAEITPCHQTPDQMRQHPIAQPGLLEARSALSRWHRIHGHSRSGDGRLGVHLRQVRPGRGVFALDDEGHYEPGTGRDLRANPRQRQPPSDH
jgi:hypothetical protein